MTSSRQNTGHVGWAKATCRNLRPGKSKGLDAGDGVDCVCVLQIIITTSLDHNTNNTLKSTVLHSNIVRS